MLILEIAAKVFGYSLFLFGLWRLVGQYILVPTFRMIVQDLRRFSYRQRIKSHSTTKKKTNAFKKTALYHHILLLLSSVQRNKSKPVQTTNFYVFSILLFSITLIMVYILLQDLGMAILTGLFFMFIPYVLLRMVHTSIKLKTTKAFMDNFHFLYQIYFSTGRNPYYLLINLPNEIDDRSLQNAFAKLLTQVQNSSRQENIRQAIQVFTFTVQSSFGIRFGNMLYRAFMDQIDISVPLQQLNEDVSKRKKDLEDEKVQKTESKMLGYFSIIIFPIFIYVAYRFTNIYDQSAIFTDPLALTLLIVCVLMTLISLFTVIMFNKPRTDL